MKVYVLMDGHSDSDDLVGVFSSEEKLQQFVSEQANFKLDAPRWIEVEVDDWEGWPEGNFWTGMEGNSHPVDRPSGARR